MRHFLKMSPIVSSVGKALNDGKSSGAESWTLGRGPAHVLHGSACDDSKSSVLVGVYCWFIACVAFGLLSGTSAVTAFDEPAKSAGDTPVIVIRGAAIHTMELDAKTAGSATGMLADGMVVVRDGKIEAVGSGLAIPDGATVIDANGLVLTPGLIDARSRLYLGDSADGQVATDGSLDVLDGLDPYTSVGAEVLAAGVTSVYLQPGRTGSFGGWGATVATGEMGQVTVLKSQAAVQMALGGVTRSGTSRARRQAYEALQKRLKDAAEYQKSWDEYHRAVEAAEKAKAAGGPAVSKEAADPQTGSVGAESTPPGESGRGPGEGRGRGRRRPPRPDGGSDRQFGSNESYNSDSVGAVVEIQDVAAQDEKPAQENAGDKAAEASPAEPKKPKWDRLKERLLPVLRREVAIRMEVHHAEEAEWALSLAKEFNLRMVLDGVSELKSATEKVQASQLPVVLGPWLASDNRSAGSDRQVEWARAFGKASGGSRIALATFADSPQGSKWLRMHAAAAVAAGLSRDQALRGITIEAAEVAGVADQVGSLKSGKRADLVLFAGDPLDSRVPVAMVISGGRVVLDRRDQVGVVVAESAPSSGSDVVTPWTGSAAPSRYVVLSQRVQQPGGAFGPGAVMVEDGILVSMLAADQLPTGVPVWDVGDSPVTSGLVSAFCVNPAAGNPIQRESDASQQFAGDGWDADSELSRGLRDTGVSYVQLGNQSSNVLAGQTAWIRLGGDGSIVRRPAAEQWVLSDSARNADRFPATLVGQVQMVRQRWMGGVSETALYLPPSALSKWNEQRLTHLESVRKGEIPVIVECHADAEVEAFLRFSAGQDGRFWILNPEQLRPFSERLAQQKIGVIAEPLSFSKHDWYVRDLVAAAQAGVAVMIAGRDGIELRMTASALVAAGMPQEQAVEAITTGAAQAFGGQPMGGLTVGAAADFVVWSGHPLDMSSSIVWRSTP